MCGVIPTHNRFHFSYKFISEISYCFALDFKARWRYFNDPNPTSETARWLSGGKLVQYLPMIFPGSIDPKSHCTSTVKGQTIRMRRQSVLLAFQRNLGNKEIGGKDVRLEALLPGFLDTTTCFRRNYFTHSLETGRSL